MAWTCPEDGPELHSQSSPEMDTTWEEKASPAKNHLEENCGLGAENGEPVLGRGTPCRTRPDQMEADGRSLMFLMERRGLSK